ncbi:MAG: dephospho-CoA kinase [Sphingomicrobium sp.]
MIRIALTGSIGMGKSTIAAMFVARGVPLFDADETVHRLYRSGAVADEIGRRFPGSTGPDGVDRVKLAKVLLAQGESVAAVEAIVHPAVARERAAFIERHRGAPVLLFDIPLLFETGSEGDYDTVIVASAPADIQRRRVLARASMKPQFLDAILERQTPDSEKRVRADFIIDTAGPIEETERQVDHILACLGLAAGQ